MTDLATLKALALCAGLAGGANAREPIESHAFSLNGTPVTWGFHILKDNGTGCEYIVTRADVRNSSEVRTAPIPRIASDGKTHMGCKDTKEGK